MSSQKTSTGQSIAQSTGASSAPVQQPVTDATNTLVVVAKSNSLQDFFERLKAGNQKQKTYEEFIAKLETFIEFRESYDGGGLLMDVSNPITGKEITITNLELILATVDKAIEMGNAVKARYESEMLALGI